MDGTDSSHADKKKKKGPEYKEKVKKHVGHPTTSHSKWWLSGGGKRI
jgi:hypothetical protein